jgi:hypothetical protein
VLQHEQTEVLRAYDESKEVHSASDRSRSAALTAHRSSRRDRSRQRDDSANSDTVERRRRDGGGASWVSGSAAIAAPAPRGWSDRLSGRAQPRPRSAMSLQPPDVRQMRS